MKASILAIGTELTTGQIINKNAASISEKLKTFGIVTDTHLTVPDNKQIILNSLGLLEASGDLLFVTGGLGPTSDDFTRDVLAEWSGLKMHFDEDTWNYINERLTSRGFPVHEMQRQQCYFPEGAAILKNSEGTAHAFRFRCREKTVYVLPGPPREIEAVWKAHIHQELENLTKNLSKIITRSWDNIGVGESDVALKVEEILKSRPLQNFCEIGYRVHLPYVEVKLSFQDTDSELFLPFVKKIDEMLSPVCVARDFFDIAEAVTKTIKKLDFTFYDFVSNGFMHSRLSPYLKGVLNWSFKQSDQAPSVDLFDHEDNFIALLPFEENQCILIFSFNGQRHQKTLVAPMKSPQMGERRRQFFAEMALVEFSRA